MLRCHTPEQVVAAVCMRKPKGILAVDGFQASGKTTLACTVGLHLGRKVVSADDYLNKNQGAFFSQLRLPELAATLSPPDNYILDGVCCLQVLDVLGISVDTIVYVKRMASWGWADEAALKSFSQHGRTTLSADGEPVDHCARLLRELWAEVAAYHVAYRPHERAHIAYERAA